MTAKRNAHTGEKIMMEKEMNEVRMMTMMSTSTSTRRRWLSTDCKRNSIRISQRRQFDSHSPGEKETQKKHKINNKIAAKNIVYLNLNGSSHFGGYYTCTEVSTSITLCYYVLEQLPVYVCVCVLRERGAHTDLFMNVENIIRFRS